MSEPLDWRESTPRSARFDDIYFSPEDGLGETQAVFLQGCDLPDRWRGRPHFTVAELGFGVGLNIMALVDLWRRSRPEPQAVLHIFSIEAYLISRRDAARALGHWPAMLELAEPLLAAWPEGRKGFHRTQWAELGVILDLGLMEAEEALNAWTGAADAWFLDGFAPSRTPEMWRPEVLQLVAARSNPGARLASFSVAGSVRRGLAAAGFEVSRSPGFGRKKQRLEARSPPGRQPQTTRPPPPERVAVIGAGIAGASLVRALVRLGHQAQLFDAEGVGAGASGNAAALVTPRLDAGLGSMAKLHAQAFARAIQLYRSETPGAILGEGALHLPSQPKDLGRFQKIAAWDGFDAGSVEMLAAAAAASALGEDAAPPAMIFKHAVVVEPSMVLATWASNCRLERVDRLQRDGEAWRLLGPKGETLMEADAICLAGGPASGKLVAGLKLRPVRGQVSMAASLGFYGASAVWGGYALPMRVGTLFGATHERDDWNCDLRDTDAEQNLKELSQGRPSLGAKAAGSARGQRASLRAMARDHSPLAGRIPDQPGLWILSGLGGRGFTLAPLLAEAVAAEIIGVPSPLPRPLADLVDPGRFEKRAASSRAASARPPSAPR